MVLEVVPRLIFPGDFSGMRASQPASFDEYNGEFPKKAVFLNPIVTRFTSWT